MTKQKEISLGQAKERLKGEIYRRYGSVARFINEFRKPDGNTVSRSFVYKLMNNEELSLPDWALDLINCEVKRIPPKIVEKK